MNPDLRVSCGAFRVPTPSPALGTWVCCSIAMVSDDRIPGVSAMASWLEEIERREAAARERIGELRARMTELSESLAEQEIVLSRLEITRETMTEILADDATVPKREPGAGVLEEAAVPERRPRWSGSPAPAAGRRSPGPPRAGPRQISSDPVPEAWMPGVVSADLLRP